MKPADSHRLFETLLARAMTATDPVRALDEASRDRRLPHSLRSSLKRVDRDGVRMAALLVARLRFERLLRGSPEAEEWFERDPASFADAFRRYHAEVAPSAFFPSAEARLFREWRSTTIESPGDFGRRA